MEKAYNNFQLTGLVVLRMLVGWHFLYEGIVKLMNPNWSAKGYLMGSETLFGLFSTLGASSGAVGVIDFVNIWALIFVGLSLILGVYNKIGSITGICLLGMYYLAYPPMLGFEGTMPTEGSYVFVNKNLIELFALWIILVFPTSRHIGLDRLFSKKREDQVISMSPR